MTLFLSIAVPLFAPLCLVLFHPGKAADRAVIISFFKGLVWFVPAVAVFLLLQNLFSLEYTVSGLYSFYLLHDYLIPLGLGLAGFFLFFGFTRTGAPGNPAETTMFFAGYFSLFGILEMIIRFRWLDVHVLFMRPVIFITLVAYVAAMTWLSLSNQGWIRALLVFGALAASAAMACIPLLFELSYRLLSFLLCFILLAAAIFFYKIVSDGTRRV